MSVPRTDVLRAWDNYHENERQRGHINNPTASARKRMDKYEIPLGTVQRMRALILSHHRAQRERLQALEDDLEDRTRAPDSEGKRRNYAGASSSNNDDINHYNNGPGFLPAKPRPFKASKRPKSHPRFVAPSGPDISSMLAEQFADLSTGSRTANGEKTTHSFLSTPTTQGSHSSPSFSSTKKRLTASSLQKSSISPRKSSNSTPSNTPMFFPTPAEIQPPQLLSGSPLKQPVMNGGHLNIPSLGLSPSKAKKAVTPSNTPLFMPIPPDAIPVWPSPKSLSLASPTKTTNNYATSIANLSPSKPIPEELSISTPQNTPMLIPTPFNIPPTSSTVTSYVDSQSGISTAPFSMSKPGSKARQPITPNNTPMNTSTSLLKRTASGGSLVSPSPLALPRHSFRSPPSMPLNSPPSKFSESMLPDGDSFSMNVIPASPPPLVSEGDDQIASPSSSTTAASILTPQKSSLSLPNSNTPTTPTPQFTTTTTTIMLTPTHSLTGTHNEQNNSQFTPPAKTPISAPPITVSKRRALMNSLSSPPHQFSDRKSLRQQSINQSENDECNGIKVSNNQDSITSMNGSNKSNNDNVIEEDSKNGHENDNIQVSTYTSAAAIATHEANSHTRKLQASTERIAWLETSVTRLKTQKEVEIALLRHQQFLEQEKANANIEKLKVENALLLRKVHDYEYKDVEIRKLNVTLNKLRVQYEVLQQEHDEARMHRVARRQQVRTSRVQTRGPFRV